jgi:hypothetical protein|nr:MAG TPA: hypothetical protein [Caudoviricetes sp.]
MGELRAVFDAMKKEREERREALEPSRVQYATSLLTEAGFVVVWDRPERALYIYRHNRANKFIARLWVYTGWWSGKGIGSERGVHKLIKKLGEI